MESPVSKVTSLRIADKGFPGVPKTMQAISTVIGYPPELVDKSLLVKTLHTLVTGHREIKLELGWRLPLRSGAPIVLGRMLEETRQQP